VSYGGRDVAQGIFGALGSIGLMLALMPSVMLDGVVFRSLSAPRAIQLIPRGQLKLLLGAFTTQLLLAALIGAAVAALMSLGSPAHRPPWESISARVAAVVVLAFAGLTVHFIGFFCTAQLRFGALWLLGYIVWPRLVLGAFARWHLHDLFSTAAGFEALLTFSLAAWLGFAIGYLRARRIRLPHRPGFGMDKASGSAFYSKDIPTAGPQRYTRRESLRMLLSATPRRRLSGFSSALLGILGFFVLVSLSTGIHGSFSDNGLFFGRLACLVAGPVAAGYCGWLANRAKSLWLPSGLGRAELCREIEARGWRVVIVVSAIAIALEAIWIGFSGSRLSEIGILVTPLASGAMLIYATLQYVRGRRILDVLIVAGCGALWFFEMICVMAGAPSQVVTTLVAVQIILVAPLRMLAVRRWQNIDWLIFKMVRSPPGLG
jgi:hypothetical protein